MGGSEHSSILRSGQSRREFVKKMAYVAPVVLTLRTTPAYAAAGSRTDYLDANPNGLNNRNDTANKGSDNSNKP
jgi:hypothetical protein